MKYLKGKPQRFLFDGCKMFWYEEKLADFMSGKRVMPTTVDMGIHKGCNMRCIFCYGTYQKPSNDFIPTDKLLEVAEDAGRCGIKGIAIIGDGEPTMNPGLYPFVEKLTECGVESAVATNGLLLDNEKTDILTKNCTWVRFNICGVGEGYRRIHKGTPEGSFERIKGIIEYAVKNKGKCTIGLQMVLVPECFDQVIPLTQFGIDMGVDYVQIKQFSDAGAGMPMHFDMDRYREVEADLKKAEAMSTPATEIVIKWQGMEDSTNITKNCTWGYDRCIDLPFLFQMSGNGKCYPCGYMFNHEENCYGNVKTERLYDILHSEKYWEIVRRIAATPLEKLCKGQCRHSQSLRFLDRFTKAYKGDMKETLAELCGSKEQYKLLKDNPPDHLAFL